MTKPDLPLRMEIIDSHTAGEPTRCVLSGGPHLGTGPLAERLACLKQRHDVYRRAILGEPRGSDVLVGALLLEPVDPACAAGVIFFNNVGYLGMCGHGTIGAVATLRYLGQIQPGEHRIETPVGIVQATLHEDGRVAVENVPSYRKAAGVTVDVPGYGPVHGDVAWGGNWFFLVEEHPFDLVLANVETLTEFTWKVRQAVNASGITGDGGAEIDHIELFSPPANRAHDSRNFVLCPGKAYDRSPCGTGTSAKMACLYADGKLQPGQVWKQEGILGSVFEGTVQVRDGQVVPSITGAAYVTAESSLIFDADDPFRMGITG